MECRLSGMSDFKNRVMPRSLKKAKLMHRFRIISKRGRRYEPDEVISLANVRKTNRSCRFVYAFNYFVYSYNEFHAISRRRLLSSLDENNFARRQSAIRYFDAPQSCFCLAAGRWQYRRLQQFGPSGADPSNAQYLNINRRIPKEQIHLGLPFYGREFNASRLYGPSTGGGEVVYSSIAPRQSSSWDYFWDEVSKVPYLLDAHRTKFVTFDDSLSLSFKCEYAKANGLAGVMIWALGQDILADTQSLVEAVGRAMAKTTGVAAEKNQNVEGFELFGNYPNPFNASTTIAFQLGQEVPVKVFIYDLHGNLVAVIKNDVVSSGGHAMTWDATGFASGIYFYKLEAAGFRDMKKMILAK